LAYAGIFLAGILPLQVLFLWALFPPLNLVSVGPDGIVLKGQLGLGAVEWKLPWAEVAPSLLTLDDGRARLRVASPTSAVRQLLLSKPATVRLLTDPSASRWLGTRSG
jgi:hypothetical protein